MESLGRWREPNPHIGPTATVQWVAPGRTGIQTWVGLVDGHKIATIKRQPGHAGSTCTALLDGWMWDMTKIPSPLAVEESVARSFDSVPAAKKAIGQAVRLHPGNAGRCSGS
ncbi:hypothetical protein ACUXLG_005609 [Ralstonia sp. 121560039-2]|nr:hypothetical protein [Ralstonia insidiosa]MBA9939915.1 hypothetical protein [Ralstonia insidiosa]